MPESCEGGGGSQFQGGVTVMAGEEAIGGIGVAGAPGGNFDHDCAVAALDKIKDRMK